MTIAKKTEGVSEGGNPSARAVNATRVMYTQKGVLDRHREFKGQRTPEAFMALFVRDGPVAVPPGQLKTGSRTE